MPVNVADRPALCDFILPAIVDRDDVVVAISTGGASPTLAATLRGRIEAVLPERIGNLARLAATFRAQVNALIVDPARRRTFWRRLVEGPAARLVLAGDDAGARRTALGELDDARRRLAPVGIAHIVGAGPGDPDLLTLKAAQLLQRGRRHPARRSRAAGDPGARAPRRRAGRRSASAKGHARWTQDEINAELVRRVRAGQTVVRLKAGDPFVFGRGGEEVEALREAGLPVAIVPGVTAALGCAASAGIPLTHRKLASAVTFVSGHSADGSREADVAGAGGAGPHARHLHGRHARPPPCAIACWAPAPIPPRRSPSSRTARGPTNGFRPAGSPTWRGSPPPIPAAMPAPASSSSARWRRLPPPCP